MGILSTVFLVFFVIVAVLLIMLVLVQNEEGDSLGGIFAGGSGSAFGSRSGNVLTRATTVLGTLFLIISLGLALLNRTPVSKGVEEVGRELTTSTGITDWEKELGISTPAETVEPEGLAPETDGEAEVSAPESNAEAGSAE
jgi:preprotein translocase subunit SecG